MSFSNSWSRYQSNPSFVLGFHGCDREIGESVVNGVKPHLLASSNDYDWLGHGTYFWESSPERALEFALERANGGRNSKGLIKNPFVVGAIINLKHCFNLMDRSCLLEMQDTYKVLKTVLRKLKLPLPLNGKNLRTRKRDCAVFEFVHNLRESKHLPAYDSIRGLFFEGSPLYPNAGILDKDHIQVCVRNPDCILGYFLPIKS